jgi:hypothetical protein
LWKTHPKVARWLLEHRIKAPIDRAERSAWLHATVEACLAEASQEEQERVAQLRAWAAAQRQEPDDIPY